MAPTDKEVFLVSHGEVPELLKSLLVRLSEAVKERTEGGEDFAVRLDELLLPIDALSQVARATNTVVFLAAVFQPDPEATKH